MAASSAGYEGIALANTARRSPLLRDLDGDDLTALLGVGRWQRHRRGDLVLRSDDDALVILLAGAAKVSRGTSLGDESISRFLGPGDVQGIIRALGQGSGDGDVVALGPVELLWLSGPGLRATLAAHASVVRSCLDVTAAQLAERYEQEAIFVGTSARERVLHRLVELAGRWGRPDGGTIRIELPITQDELAAWAGTSRESTAKVLHDLRLAGTVRTGRRTLEILDPDDLAAREHPAVGQRLIDDILGVA